MHAPAWMLVVALSGGADCENEWRLLGCLPEKMLMTRPHTPAVEEDTNGTFIGRWLSCSGSVFASSDDIGIEIASGGVFHKLYRVDAKTVMVGHGFGREGSWSVIDTSVENGPGVFQLDLDTSGVGGISSFPKVSTSPRTLLLPNPMNDTVGHYVIAP